MLLTKQPAEQIHHPMVFGGVTTVSALVEIVVTPRGLVSGAAALLVAPVLFAGAVTLTISGGSDGEQYLITVTVDDADGERRQSEVDVAVTDLSWVMPDGGAPMMTIAEFVAKFSLEEVVRMTDATGDGRIGMAFLVSALTDAQALVEASLSPRYALPLSTVPQLLKLIIADLARARLYTGAVPDGVATAASDARKALDRLRAGDIPLPGAAATPTTVSDAPVMSKTGGRAYPDGLADF